MHGPTQGEQPVGLRHIEGPGGERRGVLIGAGILCALALIGWGHRATATTYKWVDAQGMIHYSDAPPSAETYETMQGPPRSSTTGPAAPRVGPAMPATAAPTPAPDVVAAADNPRCIDALYQIRLLALQRRVFKPRPAGQRVYLADADRPAEIERLSRLRDAICSSDPEARKAQDQRAARLLEVLSPNCAGERETLKRMEDPASRTPADEIDRQRAYVDRDCPDPRREDVWLGDWIVVRWPSVQ